MGKPVYLMIGVEPRAEASGFWQEIMNYDDDDVSILP